MISKKDLHPKEKKTEFTESQNKIKENLGRKIFPTLCANLYIAFNIICIFSMMKK